MMKSLTLILALTFSVMFSSTSFAGWTRVGETVDGDNFYVDFERIRKHGGYVYFWYLSDRLKPSKFGDFSAKTYSQGDCKLFRHKWLDISYHTQPMGKGTPSTTGAPKGQKWRYPHPDSVIEAVLKDVCRSAK
jgi:hypothetical protein